MVNSSFGFVKLPLRHTSPLLLVRQGTLGWRFFLSEAMECFICVFAWLSETLHLQHNYRTASLGSLTPSFISQHHLTVFAPHWWAKEVGWCSVIRKKKVSEETARESESVFRMFRFSHTVWLQYSVRVQHFTTRVSRYALKINIQTENRWLGCRDLTGANLSLFAAALCLRPTASPPGSTSCVTCSCMWSRHEKSSPVNIVKY